MRTDCLQVVFLLGAMSVLKLIVVMVSQLLKLKTTDLYTLNGI